MSYVDVPTSSRHILIRRASGLEFEEPAVGGAVLLEDETNGFATDFTHAVDTERVAVKTAGVTTSYAVDAFYQNAGTSPKMVYDVAGVLGWSPHNMCLQSQTFDNPAPNWNKSNAAISANAVASPDGTLTADAFIPPAGSISPYINQAPTVPTGTVVTFSVYAKNGILTPWLLIQSDTSAWFNLATGVKGTTSGSPISSNMVAAGSGWYRCDMTFTAVSGTPQVYLAMTTADGSGANCTTGDGVKAGFYLWGAQMNRGTVPTAYIPTTTAARYGLALDYDPVTHAAKGLLCEPAATNEHFPSSDFDNALWAKTSCTVTANAVAAPNGANEGDALIPIVGTNNAFVNRIAVTANGAANTFSLYVKNGTLGSNWLRVAIVATPTRETWFNLATGVKGASTGSPTSYTITAVGNGWYRLTTTYTAGAASAVVYLAPETADASTAGITGNGTSPALYLWGAQTEVGAVATSLIPTTSAAVTRAVDAVTVAASSIGHSTTAGSWWAEVYFYPGRDMYSDRAIGMTVSSAPLAVTDYGSAASIETYEAPTLLSRSITPPLRGVITNVAVAYQASDRAVTARGLPVATDTVTSATLLNPAAIFRLGGGGGTSILGYIRKVRYVPRRKSNAELVTETT